MHTYLRYTPTKVTCSQLYICRVGKILPTKKRGVCAAVLSGAYQFCKKGGQGLLRLRPIILVLKQPAHPTIYYI